MKTKIEELVDRDDDDEKELGEPGSFGVTKNKTTGDVQIWLGAFVPFEIPSDTAIRLAALILKASGAAVKLSPGSLVARFRGSKRMN